MLIFLQKNQTIHNVKEESFCGYKIFQAFPRETQSERKQKYVQIAQTIRYLAP